MMLPALSSGQPANGVAELPALLQPLVVKYPDEARRQRTEGRALLRVRIGETGLVREARVYATSGSPSLDAEAVRAVSAARFKPATLREGRPVDYWYVMPINFVLDRPVGAVADSEPGGGARYFQYRNRGGALYAQIDLVTEAFCTQSLSDYRIQGSPPATVKYACSSVDGGPDLPFKARLRDERQQMTIAVAGKTEALCRVAMSAPTPFGEPYTTVDGSCKGD